MGQKGITLRSGDKETLKFKLVDDTGSAIDISSYSKIIFKIADSLNVADGSALYYVEISPAFSDPTNGIHNHDIIEDITKAWAPGEYLCQARWLDAGGETKSTDVKVCTILQNLIDDEA